MNRRTMLRALVSGPALAAMLPLSAAPSAVVTQAITVDLRGVIGTDLKEFARRLQPVLLEHINRNDGGHRVLMRRALGLDG